ncbi:MAG: GGDEF domain-containing protein [Fibrobacteria bacterium]|nr:GGDEF domain-containing protein [Fibrobacteria bacterium]
MKKVFTGLQYFSDKSHSFIFVMSIILTLFLGMVDFLSGVEISFSLFYVIPVCLTIWYSRFWLGFIMAVFSSSLWMVADVYAGHIYSHTAILCWNTCIRFSFFIIIGLLLEHIKKLYNNEEKLADTDGLTGLSNRRAFLEKIQFELDRSRRYQRPFTLAYIDLDNFKLVNDKFGHEEGDYLLCTVADELKSNLRNTDIISRLGGDEFSVLLSDANETQAFKALQKIQERLLETMSKKNWPVTFSIGAVTFNKAMDNVTDMLKLSDDLMYQVKKNRKNSIAHLSWPLHEGLSEDFEKLNRT